MPKYDQGTYNSYLQRNDYLGLSDYLYGFKFTNSTQQREMDRNAEYFRQLGQYANSIIGKADDKDLMSMYFQSKFGQYNPDNFYVKSVNEAIDNIGGANAVKIGLTFVNDEAYNNFIKSFGDEGLPYDDIEFVHTYSQGKHNVVIDKEYAKNNIDLFSDVIFGTRYGTYLAPTDYNMYSGAAMTPSIVTNPAMGLVESKGVSAFTVDNNGITNVIMPQYFNDFNTAINTFTDSKKKAEDYIKAIGQPDPNEKFNLVYTGYMCEAQGKLVEAAAKGLIKRDYANGVLKDIDDYYKNAMYHVDLNQYDEVYVTSDDENITDFTMAAPGERGVYNEMIKDAIDKNKIQYASGMANGRSGTIITLPQFDSEGKETGAHIQMFVPGLFDEDIAKVQSNMTDITAMQEYQKHKDYNYGYDLCDGGTITQFADDGVEVMKDGVPYFYDEATAKKLIERDIELRYASRAIYRACTDENGEMTEVTEDAKKMVNLATEKITKDIYGNIEEADPDGYEAEKQKIYRYLASIIGFQMAN